MAREVQFRPNIVRAREILAGAMLLAFLAIPAVADLPCQPTPIPPAPLTVGAFLDDVLGSLLQNGIAVLFVGSLVVVGLPWMMAGIAMGLLQLARRKP
jgi:hypothetical protein